MLKEFLCTGPLRSNIKRNQSIRTGMKHKTNQKKKDSIGPLSNIKRNHSTIYMIARLIIIPKRTKNKREMH